MDLSRLELAITSHGLANMHNLKIAIYGIGPIGTEVLKNLVLSCAGRIDVFDEEKTNIYDVGSNFYSRITDYNEQKSRIESIIPRIHDICLGNCVNGFEKSIDSINIDEYDGIIVTKLLPIKQMLRVSEECHKKGKLFLLTFCIGPLSFSFEDFGESHTVVNGIGLEPSNHSINSIQCGPTTKLVYFSDKKLNHKFVRLSDVQYLPEINDKDIKVIADKNGIVEIDFDSSKCICNEKSSHFGRFTERPTEISISHSSLSQVIESQALINDYVFLILIEIMFFIEEKGYHPRLLNSDDSNEVSKRVLSKYQNNRVPITFEQVTQIVELLGIEYPPAAVCGGSISSQEVVKFATKMIKPFPKQWSICDLTNLFRMRNGKPVLLGDRYDSIRSVIGNESMNKIRTSKFAIIGVGAIGCEYARQASLFGVKGVVLFDHDIIEASNLTRQFLFTSKENGKGKAEVARFAILNCNPDIKEEHVIAYNEKFNGTKFHDLGIDEVSVIFSGVDSFQSRKYISSICHSYGKVMVNSGMEGLCSNFGSYVPNVTNTYSNSNEDESKDNVPACTLKSFPTTSMHVIQWAKNKFCEWFYKIPNMINKPEGYPKEDNIPVLKEISISFKTIKDCAIWSLKEFHSIMMKSPTNLLQRHSKNSSFWSNNCFPPEPIEFDPKNSKHVSFITSLTILKAQQYHIDYDKDQIEGLVADLSLEDIPQLSKPQFVNNEEFIRLINQYKIQNPNPLKSIEYNKDNPDHLNALHSMVINRSEVYQIATISRLEVLKLSGSVAPTLPTTTSAVGSYAFNCMIPGLILGEESKTFPTLGNINLGIARINCYYDTFQEHENPWDFIEIDGEITIKELYDKIRQEHEVDVTGFLLGKEYLDDEFEKRVIDVLWEIEQANTRKKFVIKAEIKDDKRLRNILVTYNK